jgi:hypothetical protein
LVTSVRTESAKARVHQSVGGLGLNGGFV